MVKLARVLSGDKLAINYFAKGSRFVRFNDLEARLRADI